MSTIVVSPEAAGTLYAGTSAGVYKSTDRGRHWTRSGLASVKAIVFAPGSPATLYAATSFGVSKTTDGGQSWTLSGSVGCAWSVAVSRKYPSEVYAGTCGYGIFKSSDAGQRWTTLNSGLPAKAVVWDLVFDPTDPSVVYAATGEGIFKSTDAGDNWKAVGSAFTKVWIYSLAINPLDGTILYAGTSGRGVIKSADGGLNWSEPISTDGAIVQHVAIDPTNPNAVYAAAQGRGILKSIDAGQHWTAANTGLPRAFLKAWHVTVDPANPRNLYAGTFGHGLFQSSDAGATWVEADIGIHSMGINAIVVDPSAANVVFAGTASVGVFKSLNGGVTWTSASTGYAGAGVIQSMAIAPASPTHTIYAADLNDGIFVSPDAGESWSRAPWPRSLGPAPSNYANIPSALAFHPSRAEVVYAAVFAAGVFKSLDSGRNWKPMNTGLGNLNISALVIDPANPETVFAVDNQAIYRSNDAGQTWAGISTNFRVRALALSSDRSGAGTWYAGGRGMFKSSDGGHTWTVIESGFPSPVLIRSLAVDPIHSEIVYAGTEGSGMYKTIDGGKSWRLIGAAGLPEPANVVEGKAALSGAYSRHTPVQSTRTSFVLREKCAGLDSHGYVTIPHSSSGPNCHSFTESGLSSCLTGPQLDKELTRSRRHRLVGQLEHSAGCCLNRSCGRRGTAPRVAVSAQG